MNKKKILSDTRKYIRKLLGDEGSGHDWSHIERVVRNAKEIGKKEKADLFIVELAALLHDIADWKFHKGDDTVGSKKTRELLEKQKVNEETIRKVEEIVQHISYKGGTNKYKFKHIEGRVVQDSDRLDAIGAIGIARVFTFGGAIGRKIYDPKVGVQKYKNFKEFKKNLNKDFNHSINHFYEKLLLLKDKMNTKTGKKMAQNRHNFMKKYLSQFYKEWGK